MTTDFPFLFPISIINLQFLVSSIQNLIQITQNQHFTLFSI